MILKFKNYYSLRIRFPATMYGTEKYSKID